MLVSSHIDRLARMAARARYVLLLCSSLALVSACKLDAKPPSGGGLVVALDTDMSMPKDIDEVRLEVTQGSTMLFKHSQQLDENAAALPLDIQVPDANDSAPVLVRALGVKDGEIRVERSAITTVPTAYLGYLRLTLNYLCDGMVAPNGESSCGATMTCIQGTCGPAAIATSLPDFYQAEGSRRNASTACFDVAKCFSMATEMTPDLSDGCSFSSNKLFPTDINVALRLEPGSAGVCTQTACWIVLDSDGDGFRVGDNERVDLPESICAQRSQGANLRVAMSMQCPSKTQSMPLCRDGSSSPGFDVDDPGIIGMSMSPVSDACAGGGQRACEMCGTQMRMCQSGLWSAFGMCGDQGVCIPETIESCGVNGIRTCGGDCTWGDCENQTCDGPATRSCGNCGTQHRSCNNGVWSEWSVCGEEGVCMPGASQACGSGGTQACMGNCDWGDCTMQVCTGPASEPCGNCGTRSRTCDPNTAVWSDWGECEGEGECRPDSTQPCGRDGEQTCGGNCRWDVACTGQTCEGPARRACGLCGTQTRTCDMMTGEYSDWSACFGEGECMPDAISACGNGGERVCGGMCRWGTACTGQTCTGASSERCGDCGTRTRTCDTNTGAWSGWSECRNEGDCSPGETRSCGSGGMQTCSNTCRWNEACPGQMCDGPDERVCADNQCITQGRTCDMNTGSYGAWSPACTPGCVPGTLVTGGTPACPENSGRVCTEACTTMGVSCTCRTGYADCTANDTVDCVNVQEDELNCGRCGMRCTGSQLCINGMCSCPAGTCLDNGECINTGTSNEHCGGCDRPCTGDLTCGNGMCRCPEGETSCGEPNNCVNFRNDPLNCGGCGNVCRGGQVCVAPAGGGASACQCPPGTTACGTAPNIRCINTMGNDRENCGGCGEVCPTGEVCQAGDCTLVCEGTQVVCGGRCVDRQTDGQHCGSCNNVCTNGATCQGGMCRCPAGTGPCGEGMACLPLNTPMNCGQCDEMCMDGAMCVGGDCVCTGGQTDCGGDCVNTQTDEAHCGGCDIACDPGVTCTGGICGCPMGQARCGGPTSPCVPLNASPNCGECGEICDPGEMCSNGDCVSVCMAPATRCGDTCVNTQMSDMHCGGCNMPCTNGTTCQGGDCLCPPGTGPCGPNNACVPLNTNMNCGTCGIACTGGRTCEGNMCDCPGEQAFCGSTCVDTQTNEQHCGDCDRPCPAGTMCEAGLCSCPAGQARCGGPTSACVPLNTDQNCGTCANDCDEGTSCMGAMCRPDCAGPNELCDGMCVNTQTSNAHCGGCNDACNADETCRAGECECAGNTRRCGDGSCEARSVNSCGPSCAPCRDIPNGVAVGCDSNEQCQYDCAGPTCGTMCCAAGQTCTAGVCQTPPTTPPPPPPPPPQGGGGAPPPLF